MLRRSVPALAQGRGLCRRLCSDALPAADCVKFEHVVQAHHRSRKHLVHTNILHSHWLSQETGSEIILKMEQQQFTGSFKERGACNALLSLSSEVSGAGVKAASAGNHALALSYHGGNLGIVRHRRPNRSPLLQIRTGLRIADPELSPTPAIRPWACTDPTCSQRSPLSASASAPPLTLDLAVPPRQPVTVVMPTVAPLAKVDKCRALGANVIVHGAHIGEAKEWAMENPELAGMHYINGYDDPAIIAGAGTLAIEALEKVATSTPSFYP